MVRFSGNALEDCLTLFGVLLVQCEIPMHLHWKLKPSACPRRASVQAVLSRLFLCCFLKDSKHLERSSHHICSAFRFHDPLIQNICHFHMASAVLVFGTSRLCLLWWQSLYCKCLFCWNGSHQRFLLSREWLPRCIQTPRILKKIFRISLAVQTILCCILFHFDWFRWSKSLPYSIKSYFGWSQKFHFPPRDGACPN